MLGSDLFLKRSILQKYTILITVSVTAVYASNFVATFYMASETPTNPIEYEYRDRNLEPINELPRRGSRVEGVEGGRE